MLSICKTISPPFRALRFGGHCSSCGFLFVFLYQFVERRSADIQFLCELCFVDFPADVAFVIRSEVFNLDFLASLVFLLLNRKGDSFTLSFEKIRAFKLIDCLFGFPRFLG